MSSTFLKTFLKWRNSILHTIQLDIDFIPNVTDMSHISEDFIFQLLKVVGCTLDVCKSVLNFDI